MGRGRRRRCRPAADRRGPSARPGASVAPAGRDRSTSPAYQRENPATASRSSIGASAFSVNDGSVVSHVAAGTTAAGMRIGGPRAVAGQLRDHRGEVAAGRVAGDRQPGAVGAEFAGVLGDPLRCGPRVVDGGGVRVFGCQPVVHRDHQRAGADGVLAGGSVVGVQIADDQAAAVEEHHHRRRVPAPDPAAASRSGPGSGRPARRSCGPRRAVPGARAGAADRGTVAGSLGDAVGRTIGTEPLPVPSAGWRRRHDRCCPSWAWAHRTQHGW